MKIALNCIFLQPRAGGIREYIHNLLTNLSAIDSSNEYVVYVLKDMEQYARTIVPRNFRIKSVPFGAVSIIQKVIRGLKEQEFWQKEEVDEQWDVFHSPFFHSPTLAKTPVILTVHDMRFFRFPKSYSFLRYHYLRKKVRKSIRNASAIIAISNFTKNEIIAAYNVDDKKIRVIHEAIDPGRFAQKNTSIPIEIPESIRTGRYLLTVGHLEPRKNYDRLIAAFERIKKSEGYEDVKLVIVGKKGHSYASTIRAIDKNPDIHYMDFVSHDTLIWLYGNADLFVFPSYYEGFGFPPLEAASFGVVSSVSNVSSMPEICGDAVIYFNPYDIADMADKIASGLDRGEEYHIIKNRLKEQLKKFSWRTNAEETLRIYQKVSEGEHNS